MNQAQITPWRATETGCGVLKTPKIAGTRLVHTSLGQGITDSGKVFEQSFLIGNRTLLLLWVTFCS